MYMNLVDFCVCSTVHGTSKRQHSTYSACYLTKRTQDILSACSRCVHYLTKRSHDLLSVCMLSHKENTEQCVNQAC